MIESWLSAIQKAASGRSVKSLKRMWAVSPGAWIAGMVVLLVGFQTARVQIDHAGQGRLRAITAAFGAANTFYGVPQMSHDGSRITYVATTEARNCKLFLYNTLTKQQHEIVCEQNGLGVWRDDFDLRAWPWSPDDSSFVYSMLGRLVICSAEFRTNRVELTVGTNAVSQVVWLSPTELAYVGWANTLCYAQKQADGQWRQHQLPCYDDISNLTAVSTHTVAWLQDGFICHLNLDKNLEGTNNPFSISAHSRLPTKGLTLWLDASTLEQPNQTPVNQLRDLSPSRNTAFADGHPPLFNAPGSSGALNGNGTIHFSSSNSPTNATRLKTERLLGIKGSAPRTIFTVMRREILKNMVVSTGVPGGAPGAYFGVSDRNSGLFLPATWVRDNRFDPIVHGWHILTVVYNGTTEKGYVNGVLKGTSRYRLNTVDAKVSIGVRNRKNKAASVVTSDGDFAELLIYDRALNNAERQQVENYLERKWYGIRKITAQNPLVWIDPRRKGITGFAYSKKTGQLLISVANRPDTTLWRYDFNANPRMSRLAQASATPNPQWVSSRQFAYIGEKSGHKPVVFSDIFGVEQSRLFEHGNIKCFNLSSHGEKLLFTGAVSNEPASGIWQYDLKSGHLQSLVSYSDHPTSDARKIVPFHGTIKLPSGRSVDCYIYPPARIDPHKKYPLVISDTVVDDPIHGPMFQSGIAACGAYVAIVNRSNWGTDIWLWGRAVQGLYQNLKQDPAIDSRRVYLFAASAETHFMSELVEKTPGPWKGIILLNPGELPDFSKLPRFERRPNILLIAGSREGEDKRFKRYQEKALSQGALVQYIIAPGETHRFVGKAAKLERAEAVEHFIFDE